jgi:signal transduction histidine kinase
MQARIVDLVRSRVLLHGAISHDLKTYITRLRLRVEQLADNDQRNKAVRDLDDMTSLIDDALAVARGTFVAAGREAADLRALLADLVEDRSNAHFCSEGDAEPALVEGQPVALRRLFANVIDNALRFGTSCEIALASCGAHLAVTIDDDGPGIPEDERQKVLDPFYRLEPSRNRATGGSGMGLAIAKQICEAHGGSILIAASPQGGVRAVVTLPAAPSGADCSTSEAGGRFQGTG